MAQHPLSFFNYLQSTAAPQAPEMSLSTINHVVLFMQENRAFDHYFGTMSGVRGFSDPNVQVNDNVPVWYQKVNTSETTAPFLMPWYLNYEGGNASDATQCMVAGTNSYQDNHAALGIDETNNYWALNNTPWSLGYYKSTDLPVHFSIAEGWTVGDMYQESVIASTTPNRVAWISGSINAPGGPQTPDQGGIVLDNNETPGCEGPNLNCYPYSWKTFPEFLEAANVSWQLYQDKNNFDDNPLAWFTQFQMAKNSSQLHQRGTSFKGLDAFYQACADGTLPQVSYIVGPAELSEHPPYRPQDGAWLQWKVVDALVNSQSYKDTALLISYDETGGWADHVVPYHSPPDTAGEWIEDPYDGLGQVYTGPGFRLPFYIVSPWTRGGNVFTENSDHISQIKFVEQWLQSKGISAKSDQIPTWRADHMSDLVKAFDFAHPDYSIPTIPQPATPPVNKAGDYDGYAVCEATYPSPAPVVPYGKQSANTSLISEDGFKVVRGQLTEGRFLTFEQNGFALTNSKGRLNTSRAAKQHDTLSQRFWIQQPSAGVPQYTIRSALDNSTLSNGFTFSNKTNSAMTFMINDLGNGAGYSMQTGGSNIGIGKDGNLQEKGGNGGFDVFSVTYSS